jgi:hypothetical protein
MFLKKFDYLKKNKKIHVVSSAMKPYDILFLFYGFYLAGFLGHLDSGSIFIEPLG